MMTHVVMPSVAPYIFTAFRIALGVSWMSIVAAELVAASSGLGYMIMYYREVLRTDAIIVGMLTIGVIGLMMDLGHPPARALADAVASWLHAGMTASPKIAIASVSKRFDSTRGQSVTALEHVDLTIAAGEFLTIVGPSGCGKSTLLNIIAGFETASSGQVTLDGRPHRGTGPGAWRRVPGIRAVPVADGRRQYRVRTGKSQRYAVPRSSGGCASA